MLKKCAIITVCAAAMLCAAHARITSFGEPAKYGLSPSPENWYDVNPYTWDVFTTFDGDKIMGAGTERYTMLGAECYSTGVI